MVLVIRLSKDGDYGLSGGLDSYVALWNASKKILLSKIEVPGMLLKTAAINLNGQEIIFASNHAPIVYVFHHYSNKKQVVPTFELAIHKALVNSLEISDDGLLGVSGSNDKTVALWNLQTGELLRHISFSSFVTKVAMTAMGKFVSVNLIDGTVVLYETLTGITWRTEKFQGRHSAIALRASSFMFEVAKEGREH